MTKQTGMTREGNRSEPGMTKQTTGHDETAEHDERGKPGRPGMTESTDGHDERGKPVRAGHDGINRRT